MSAFAANALNARVSGTRNERGSPEMMNFGNCYGSTGRGQSLLSESLPPWDQKVISKLECGSKQWVLGFDPAASLRRVTKAAKR
jgi:hypothetical protein